MVKLLFLAAIAPLSVWAQTSPQFGQLTVKIEGIENTKGAVNIGLYNAKKHFPLYSKNYKGASIRPSTSGITHTFAPIPVGTYAIAVWHDENDNKKIDKNWLGIPTEDYGFSLNKYGLFGPPDFDDVSFSVTKSDVKSLTIKLK